MSMPGFPPNEFFADPVIYEERVIAKWTSPLGGWSNRISRGMVVRVHTGSVEVVIAYRFLAKVFGLDQWFSNRDVTITVTGEPSTGYPRRSWVVFEPVVAGARAVAVATQGDNQYLLAALAAAGFRRLQ